MKLPLARAAEFMSATGEFDHAGVASDTPSTRERFNPAICFSRSAASGSTATIMWTLPLPKAQWQRWSRNSGPRASLPRHASGCRGFAAGAATAWGGSPPSVGQAVDRRDWLGRQNHNQGNDCSRVVDPTSCPESQGNLNNHFGMPCSCSSSNRNMRSPSSRWGCRTRERSLLWQSWRNRTAAS